MHIAIIGAGNIGGALAQGWAKKGHRIFFGVKDPVSFESNPRLTTYQCLLVYWVVL